MPVQYGMGQSQMTFDKQDGLALILGQHIAIVRTILDKYGLDPRRYHYIDLTAGCGYNEVVDCEGSPIVFQKTIRAQRISYNAHFVDLEPTNTLMLRGAISQDKRVFIHTGDHAIIAPQIIETWPDTAYGLIYSDMNGMPPFELLSALSKSPKVSTVDFLIRCNGNGIKRAGRRFLDELHKIDKQHWIVREIDSHDKWQWTFLLGLNWNGLKCMREHGFHYITSDEGRAIIRRLHYTRDELKAIQSPQYATYAEYLAHPRYRAIRQQAIDRSGGTCEQCKERPVSEVHHVQYPAWGTFEKNADHLLAMCHPCHCQIHDKED